MTGGRHLTWEAFDETLLRPGVPCIHPIQGTPSMAIVVEKGASSVGLRCSGDVSDEDAVAATAAIEVRRLKLAGQNFVEISTRDSELFKVFYALLTDIADRVQLASQPLGEALRAAMRDWARLLQRAARLSDEAEVGLWGEIYFLQRVVENVGEDAIHSWVGPLGEAHDFRSGSVEIEVKTTTASTRTHRINGLSQLVPSPGCTLAIVSYQLRAAGAAGRTLPQLIRETASRITTGALRQRFEELLDGVRYSVRDEPRYTASYDLRSDPGIVIVSPATPRITPEILAAGLRPDLLADVSEVHYRINLERHVVLEDNPLFRQTLSRFFNAGDEE